MTIHTTRVRYEELITRHVQPKTRGLSMTSAMLHLLTDLC